MYFKIIFLAAADVDGFSGLFDLDAKLTYVKIILAQCENDCHTVM